MTLQLTARIGDIHYTVNARRPHDICIPVRFEGPQLSVFGAPPARRTAYAAAGFIGDVRQGGSCNCDIFSFAAHTNGTHTECVGHIAHGLISVYDILHETLIPATLITVESTLASECQDTYDPVVRPDDKLITQAALKQALHACLPEFLEGIVIRTTPNAPAKITRDYDRERPAFFSVEGIRYLTERGIMHLLTDIPSIDRLDDEGKLTNHHIFWNVPPGHHPRPGEKLSLETITELIYVSDDICDGEYLLDLQVAPIGADASPSRPILYELSRQ